MLAVFLVVVLVYLAIGAVVALVMRWLLRGGVYCSLVDCCIYAIAWPVVVVLALMYSE